MMIPTGAGCIVPAVGASVYSEGDEELHAVSVTAMVAISEVTSAILVKDARRPGRQARERRMEREVISMA
ncbi:hypothetical protein AOE01nite_06940 [Acetobacter oeni]|uniref:Uncharacterized protein n=1 Tax=Acetobacter oeni TaxID=304077 RepID=A0A511XHP4_9PROT|nr:hypothetical protein AOE01nite_06940 [Acetobacter oeni]